MLDVIRAYYSRTSECQVSAEDGKTIRVSLLGLVKYYVAKEITFEELNQLLGFIAAVHEENLVSLTFLIKSLNNNIFVCFRMV